MFSFVSLYLLIFVDLRHSYIKECDNVRCEMAKCLIVIIA